VAAGIDASAAGLRPTRRGGLAALSLEVVDGPGFATFAELTAAVAASALEQRTVDRVCAVAARMAAAERAVHGGEHEPHLHELACLDTAVDLVAVAAFLDLLAPEKVIASPPALGGGSVGKLARRAAGAGPAVMELLRGLPMRGGGSEEDGELTTRPAPRCWPRSSMSGEPFRAVAWR